MVNLQVKNLPDDLHAALAARAQSERISMSEFVTRILRRELERPSVDEWVGRMRSRAEVRIDIDAAAVIDEIRENQSKSPS